MNILPKLTENRSVMLLMKDKKFFTWGSFLLLFTEFYWVYQLPLKSQKSQIKSGLSLFSHIFCLKWLPHFSNTDSEFNFWSKSIILQIIRIKIIKAEKFSHLSKRIILITTYLCKWQALAKWCISERKTIRCTTEAPSVHISRTAPAFLVCRTVTNNPANKISF